MSRRYSVWSSFFGNFAASATRAAVAQSPKSDQQPEPTLAGPRPAEKAVHAIGSATEPTKQNLSTHALNLYRTLSKLGNVSQARICLPHPVFEALHEIVYPDRDVGQPTGKISRFFVLGQFFVVEYPQKPFVLFGDPPPLPSEEREARYQVTPALKTGLTRDETLRRYTNYENGYIRGQSFNPNVHFTCEPIYSPHFWARVCLGDGEHYTYGDGSIVTSILRITDDERANFPELGEHNTWVVIEAGLGSSVQTQASPEVDHMWVIKEGRRLDRHPWTKPEGFHPSGEEGVTRTIC